MKRKHKDHPALVAFIVTLTLALGVTGAFSAVWNTRATLFGKTDAEFSLEQDGEGLQLRVFDAQYTLSADGSSPWRCVLPPALRAAALCVETEADLLARWLENLVR